MANFRGVYDVSLDSKGRFLLPVAFRKQLPEGTGGTFVITRGFEQYLLLYTPDVWDPIADNISEMNDMLEEVRDFKRLFLSPAVDVDVDSADRIMVPKSLLEDGGITKDMVMVSAGNKMELWDKDTYTEYVKQKKGGLSKLANDIAQQHGNPFVTKKNG
jgi:MraZ protein